jgi:hypothetical protein
MTGHITRVHSSYSVDPSRFPDGLAGRSGFGRPTLNSHSAVEPLLKVGELAAGDNEGSSANVKVREPFMLFLLGAGLLGLGGIARRRLIKSRSLKHPSKLPSASVLTDAR